MRRAFLLALLMVVALPAAAGAHPLGNFSVNHVATLSVSEHRIDVRYTLDQAEIPTFQERGLSRAALLARKRAEVANGLSLTVDGRRVPLTLAPGGELSLRDGQGGLETTRVVLRLRGEGSGRTVVVRDRTFAGRVGWRAIRAVPGRGTSVRSSVAVDDPTRDLTVYPEALLRSPSDVREATLRVAPGDGSVTGPRSGPVAAGGASHGFEALLDGDGVLVLLLLAAFGWGAVHALSPGHGKGMVAAYLVGTRGRARDAIALGAIVTVTHTIGVFALGLVTLALSAYVLPEDLYPWLNLAAGCMVVGVGLAVLRSRAKPHHHHGHDHDHHHRGIVAMGVSAGLIPCPSALVVLLGAIAQHEVALGLLLITTFSLGLAATLTALGLLVVKAARLPIPARAARVLPALSAAAIVVVGVVLTAQAIGVIRS
jgi:ABC-type nickel/cobalt efflux system permease component RcnA